MRLNSYPPGTLQRRQKYHPYIHTLSQFGQSSSNLIVDSLGNKGRHRPHAAKL